jgi:hypothetical protein
MNAHAERLIWLARLHPEASVTELAFAAERSEAWTRKVLKQAGLTAAKTTRVQKPATNKRDATLCLCGHRRDQHCRGVASCTHWNPWRQVRDRDRPGWLKKIPVPELKARVFIGGTHCTVCDCCTRYHGPQKANQTTPCANPECGCAKNLHCWTKGKRKGGTGPYTAHYSLPDGTPVGWYQCLSNHCTSAHYRDGKQTACLCMAYCDPYAKGKRNKKTIPAAEMLEFENAEEETEEANT